MSELPAAALELKDKGNKRCAEQDYEQAISYYAQALEAAPGNAVLLSNLSASHLGLKQWKQALARAEECLAADPGFTKAYGRKAAAQLGLIRPGDAERTLLAGLKQDPSNEFLKSELQKLRADEDGDQSPRRCRDGSDRPLRDMQARVGLALVPGFRWPNDTFMAAFTGHEQAFLKYFKQEDLRLRATEARLPLVIVVVSGAQRIRSASVGPHGRQGSDAERGSQHAAVLRRLLEAGARVDGRDAAGWTALHHATAHHPVLDLAEMLIAAGADVNAQDRFGTYPLVSAVMSAEVKSVKMLLAHGARPDLKDNDGCDALSVSSYNSELQALVHQAQYSNRRPGGVERVCAACGKQGAKKACAGCSAGVYYCSRDCQTAHWPAHKAACRRQQSAAGSASGASAEKQPQASSALPRELRVPLVEKSEFLNLVNYQSLLTPVMANFVGVAPDKAKKLDPRTAFIERDPQGTASGLAAAAKRSSRDRAMKVKIQVPQEVPPPHERAMLIAAGECPDALLCYNQDRSVICRLDGGSPAGSQLASLIRRQGIMGLKGYFAAHFDEQCLRADGVPREIVVSTTMLPAQPF